MCVAHCLRLCKVCKRVCVCVNVCVCVCVSADAIERAESIAIARGAHGGVASAEAQQAARDLLRDILAGDTGAEGAIEVSKTQHRRVGTVLAACVCVCTCVLAGDTGAEEAIEVSKLSRVFALPVLCPPHCVGTVSVTQAREALSKRPLC